MRPSSQGKAKALRGAPLYFACIPLILACRLRQPGDVSTAPRPSMDMGELSAIQAKERLAALDYLWQQDAPLPDMSGLR